MKPLLIFDSTMTLLFRLLVEEDRISGQITTPADFIDRVLRNYADNNQAS